MKSPGASLWPPGIPFVKGILLLGWVRELVKLGLLWRSEGIESQHAAHLRPAVESPRQIPLKKRDLKGGPELPPKAHIDSLGFGPIPDSTAMCAS